MLIVTALRLSNAPSVTLVLTQRAAHCPAVTWFHPLRLPLAVARKAGRPSTAPSAWSLALPLGSISESWSFRNTLQQWSACKGESGVHLRMCAGNSSFPAWGIPASGHRTKQWPGPLPGVAERSGQLPGRWPEDHGAHLYSCYVPGGTWSLLRSACYRESRRLLYLLPTALGTSFWFLNQVV